MSSAKPHSPCWQRLSILLGLPALTALIFTLLPYPTARALGDHLSADGSLEVLTPTRWHSLQIIGTAIGTWLLLCAALMVGLRHRIEAHLQAFCTVLRALPQRLREESAAMRHALQAPREPATLIYLLLLSALGAFLRFLWLDAPVQYDEAYTAIAFASRPVRALISDYHLPNNHVFHTLLVHFSLRLFGVHPWSLRMPVYLAGILLIPLGYLSARALYSRPVARLSAAFIAVSHPLILYAANARGYTLIALFTLAGLLLAAYILRHDSLPAWFGLAVIGALGAWTVPIMLYPFGMILAWLFLGWLLGDAGRPRPGAFLVFLIACAFLTLAGALFLYLPILLNNGPQVLIGNRWVSPLPWDILAEELPARLRNTWQEWHTNLPALLAWSSNVCLGVALLAGGKQRRFRSPLWAAILIGILPILLIQRVAPIAKVWLFAQPLWLMGVAVGLWMLAQKGDFLLGLPRPLKTSARALWVAALLLGLVAIPWEYGLRQETSRGALGEMPAATDYILAHWQAGDGVVISNSYDAPLWFAFAEHGVGKTAFPALAPQREYKRIWQVTVLDEPPPKGNPMPAIHLSHLRIYLLSTP